MHGKTLEDAEKQVATLGHESWLFALGQEVEAPAGRQSPLEAELRDALCRALLACETYALLKQRGRYVLTVKKEGGR